MGTFLVKSIPAYLRHCTLKYVVHSSVTGQNIPPAGLYPGLKRSSLDYTRVYYDLGQFMPQGILWPRPIHTPSGQIIPNHAINCVERYAQ